MPETIIEELGFRTIDFETCRRLDEASENDMRGSSLLSPFASDGKLAWPCAIMFFADVAGGALNVAAEGEASLSVSGISITSPRRGSDDVKPNVLTSWGASVVSGPNGEKLP